MEIDLAPEKKCLEDDRFLLGQKTYLLGGVCCQFQGGYFFFNSESSEIMEKHLNNAEFQAVVFLTANESCWHWKLEGKKTPFSHQFSK